MSSASEHVYNGGRHTAHQNLNPSAERALKSFPDWRDSELSPNIIMRKRHRSRLYRPAFLRWQIRSMRSTRRLTAPVSFFAYLVCPGEFVPVDELVKPGMGGTLACPIFCTI